AHAFRRHFSGPAASLLVGPEYAPDLLPFHQLEIRVGTMMPCMQLRGAPQCKLMQAGEDGRISVQGLAGESRVEIPPRLDLQVAARSAAVRAQAAQHNPAAQVSRLPV